MAVVSEWRKLPLSLAELCIETTLRCGQAFRWRKIGDEWHCALQGRIVSLKQDSTHLHYRATWPSKAVVRGASTSGSLLPTPPLSGTSSETSTSKNEDADDADDTLALLQRYFCLNTHSLTDLYATWSATDPNFARRAPAFAGVRILNQDAWEALVAFICSSNNNIARIAQMVSKLCVEYGKPLGTTTTTTTTTTPGEGEAEQFQSQFHDFPPPEALLAPGVEARLRALGFGYRAKYIAETARVVARERPAGWLCGLRNPESPALSGADVSSSSSSSSPEAPPPPPTYKAAHQALLDLVGVGPKVADCVCLMGLGWGEAVPVDTHVWQIAQRDYKFGKGKGKGKGSAAAKTKTFSKAMYDAVGDHFRGIWGPQAGWAQSVLFTANLRSFAEQASAVTTTTTTKNKKKKKVDVVGAAADSLVKVEETAEIVADGETGRTRKRKTVKVEVAVSTSDDKSEIAEVRMTRTRASKRRRV